jgi:hypothetical protein
VEYLTLLASLPLPEAALTAQNIYPVSALLLSLLIFYTFQAIIAIKSLT